MVKKIITTFLQFCFFITISYGQETVLYPDTNKQIIPVKSDTMKKINIPDNSFYIELLGNALLFSLNYERIVLKKKHFYLSGRIGGEYLYSYIDHNGGGNNKFIIVALINAGRQLRKNLFIETGVGGMYLYDRYRFTNYGPQEIEIDRIFGITSLVGIRIQGNGGFLFRAGFTPNYLITYYDSSFLPLVGISFGYSF